MTTTDVGRRFREAVGRDLLAARKARDEVRTRALRSLLAAVDNGEAVPAPQIYDPAQPGLGMTEVPRLQLDAATVHGLVATEIRERREAAAGYRQDGQTAAAATLEQEAAIIEAYLDDDTRSSGQATNRGT